MVWISSQSKSKDRINKEARGTELDHEEYKPHVKVPGPNKRHEILQGLRQPKQSHSFSMTPEEQGIHKMGQNSPACLQECSYDTALLLMVTPAPVAQQPGWSQPPASCMLWRAPGPPAPCKKERGWRWPPCPGPGPSCCPREVYSTVAIALDCRSGD